MSNNRFLAKEIAQILLEKQAVKISTDPPFTWTSGMKSPIYCDNRLLISYPEERKKILEGFKNLIAENNLEFDVIGGTATAAIPWAAFLAFDLDKPMVYIRPKPKGHGAGRRVEGTMEKGSRVLIVEDLISTGGSSIRSAQACEREFDAKIVAAMAIFTYGFEISKKGFEEFGIPFFTLSDFTSLVEVLDVSEEERALVLGFSEDPEGWGRQCFNPKSLIAPS